MEGWKQKAWLANKENNQYVHILSDKQYITFMHSFVQ